MRILLAALAGAIAMFVWTAVAHMATPLGRIGFSQMPNEAAVIQPMGTNIGAQPGLYIFPYVDPNDPKMMEKYNDIAKTSPSGMLLYRPAGDLMGADMTPMLIKEFIKQFVQALIAAWIVSRIAASFIGRTAVVTAIGVSTGIATNVSYWNWYGFPLNYTEAQIIVEVVSALVAGLAISAVLPRKVA
ncbi:MAG TPA: hypothetical protein VMF58_15390 [Rhizomicrobium sp.]|nr:hypothetical protein [Rhizomicrobium sp.]